MLAGRSAGGRLPPRTMILKTDGSMRASAVGTSETRVAPSRAAAMTAVASKPGSTVTGTPAANALVMTENPPMCDSGRHASQWSVVVTFSRALVARADDSSARWVRTTPFGMPVEPLVAMTNASPGSTGSPSRRDVPSIVTTWVGRVAASTSSRAGSGRRWSMGSTASPRSQILRSSSTNNGPAGRSIATSSATSVEDRAPDERDLCRCCP